MTRPAFTHPVFDELYARDFFIADEVLRAILALGPTVAVPQLLKITDAALDDFAAGRLAAVDWFATYHFQRALHLLHELHAPEALDVYRRVLRLDAGGAEFWFGDDLFEEVPALLARAAHTRLPELLALLEDPQVLLQHRMVASDALLRLVRERPATGPAVAAGVGELLRRVVASPAQARQLFPPDPGTYGYAPDDFLAGLLADMQQAGLRELEPEMRELHRLGLVDESVAGGAAAITFDTPYPLRPVPDVFARYQELRDDPESYSPYHPDAAGIARRRAEQQARYEQQQAEYYTRPQPPQPRVAPPRPGRNDPCPCGSGRKYKKCHGA